MWKRRNQYDTALLKEAHKRVGPHFTSEAFWLDVAKVYHGLAGVRVKWTLLRDAGRKRGLRSVLKGSSRSTSRWGRVDA